VPGFQLHLISDRAAAAPPGVDYLQVRLKGAPAADVYAAALASRRGGAGLIVNDRVDVALAVGDGVHLARRSLAPGVARRLLREGQILGVSVHSVAEAREAALAGADYVTFGHVFSTPSKPGLPPRGVEELAAVVAAVDRPVLAIGGIDPRNLEPVLATGCAGIAVISAIRDASDPAAAAAALRRVLDGYAGRPRFALPRPAAVSEGGESVAPAAER
jgi:thiamine-phosphate pyrophosphorylase